MNTTGRYTERIQVLLDQSTLEKLQRKAATRGLGISALVRGILMQVDDDTPKKKTTRARRKA